MLASIVKGGDVVQFDGSVFVNIQFVESLCDQSFSSCVQVTLKVEEELVEVDSAVLVVVELLHDLGGLLFGEVEAVIDEAPSEVVAVQLAVAIIVHGFENPCDSLDAASAALENFRLDLGNEVFDREFVELFDSLGERGIRGRYDNEVVLLVLEAGGDVGSRVAGLLELQVLRLVLPVEGVAHDFPFAAEFVAVTD